jgi:hypothetical protein
MENRSSLARSRPEDMPPPSVELMLLSVIFRAQMQTLSTRKQQRFVKTVMDAFEAMEAAGTVVRLRSPKYDAEVLKARREALAWVRGAMAAAWQLDALKGLPK